jgi:predicted phage tail protein
MITIRRIRNIYDVSSHRAEVWTTKPQNGALLTFYLPDDFGISEGHNIVLVNSQALRAGDLARYKPLDGDEIVLVDVPGIIAALIGAEALAELAVLELIGVLAADFIITSAISIGAGVAASALVAPNIPRTTFTSEDDTTTPSRGFAGVQTTVGGGRPIPFIYGTARVGGHIIESFFQPRFHAMDDADTNVTTVTETNVRNPAVTKLNTRTVLCWGPIESISEIEIDDNPIENVKGTRYEVLLGDDGHRAPDGFAESKNTIAVNTALTAAGGPVIRTTTQAVDTVECEVIFPSGLFEHDANGNLIETEVDIDFDYKKTADVSWTTFKTVTFAHKIRSQVRGWVRFPVLERDIYDIRLDRVTADNVQVSPPKEDDSNWNTLNEIIGGSERVHPGLAQLALRQVPMEQQRAPRNYTALIQGFNDVRIYSSAGSYTSGWTDNPAWCCAHFLTNAVHGLGKFFDWTDIDIPSFLDWANYNDELVDDGRGTIEKRNLFGFVFDETMTAQDILRIFTKSSGAFLIQAGGKWRIILDNADSPIQGFNEGNIIPGSLTYTWIPTSQRGTRINANFVNEELNYQRDVFLQEDPNELGGHTDLNADYWGITRPSQIARESLRLLNHNRLSTRAVDFQVGLEGLTLTAGSLFRLAVPVAGQTVASGKLQDVRDSGQYLVLDENVTLDSGTTYEIVVIHKLDSRIERKQLTGVTDDITYRVEVSNTKWVVNPQPGDSYHLGEVNDADELFRVVEITMSDRFTRKIRGVLYDEDIYDLTILSNPDSAVIPAPRPAEAPPAVDSTTVSERDPEDTGTNTEKVLDVDWWVPEFRDVRDRDSFVPRRGVNEGLIDHYTVWFRRSTDDYWVFAGWTQETHFEIVGVQGSVTYEVKVIAVSASGASLHLDNVTTATVATT